MSSEMPPKVLWEGPYKPGRMELEASQNLYGDVFVQHLTDGGRSKWRVLSWAAVDSPAPVSEEGNVGE